MSVAVRTTDPICPHCGHVVRDAWELETGDGYGEGDGETECDECEKAFGFSRHVTVTYSTRPLKGTG